MTSLVLAPGEAAVVDFLASFLSRSLWSGGTSSRRNSRGILKLRLRDKTSLRVEFDQNRARATLIRRRREMFGLTQPEHIPDENRFAN